MMKPGTERADCRVEGPRVRAGAKIRPVIRAGGRIVCPVPNPQSLAPALRWADVMRRLACQNPEFVLWLVEAGINPAPNQPRVCPVAIRKNKEVSQVRRGIRDG